ncbi:pyrroloquinoline quinone biosynthesis peptide chaperone PqqD [Steroidobacter sp.]|uniref:pyrroloquinoline quinone biosynthesis peptide chaperone PqqD n=1 Tax=Steroidobacter sp. TaxID=1978227 RepID=UPI001A5CBAF3|nr:pyrroloquinoline quinone biosynthesis peptide chaperone PqqD [Steroidobacter sp.]MBL8270053.1 pyrroloquinoline quinone biosynthesis peptide chaperone PqqD [Steroidobacter sp.]
MTPADCPSIRAGIRLQWEDVQKAYVLLYPEGMVKLNTSAAEILRRCDGVRNVDAIVEDLETAFKRNGLRDEVVHFLELATAQGWIGAPP